MTATTPTALLVYGTLRRGEANHGLIRDLVSPAGLTVTVPGWALYAPRRAWFPYAVPTPGERLVADLLEFDPDVWPTALARTDRLEGYPRHYDRQVVNAYYPEPTTGAKVQGWIYTPTVLPPDCHLIPGGDWRALTSVRPAHGVTG